MLTDRSAAALENVSLRWLLFWETFYLLQQSVTFTSLFLASNYKCIKLVTRRCKQNIIRLRDIQGDSLARGPKHFGKSIPEFGETHSSVLGCERRPVSASIIAGPVLHRSRYVYINFHVIISIT